MPDRPFVSTAKAPPALAACLLACALATGCSGTGSAESGPSTGSRGSASPPPSTGPAAPGQGGVGIQAGTLTSGAWDDNLNFDFYLGYVDAATALERQDPAWPLLPRADRLELLVTNEQGAPLGDFALWGFVVEEARLIAGFGEIRWLAF